LEWLLIETASEEGAAVLAWRPSDGVVCPIFEGAVAPGQRPGSDRLGRRIAVELSVASTIPGRPDTRLALVDLPTRGVSFAPWSLDAAWRLGAPAFSPSGGRLVVEGAHDGVPRTDLFAFDVATDGLHVCAGVGNPARRSCRSPTFIDEDSVLYLRNTRGSDWEICLLDIAQAGPPDGTLPGDPPTARGLTLTECADALPGPGVAFAAASRRIFFVAASGTGAQYLRSMQVGGAPTAAHRTHGSIEACAALGPDCVYLADGAVWRATTEAVAEVYAPRPGRAIVGLCQWGADGVAFGERDADGLVMHRVDAAGGTHLVGSLALDGEVRWIDAPTPHADLDAWLLGEPSTEEAPVIEVPPRAAGPERIPEPEGVPEPEPTPEPEAPPPTPPPAEPAAPTAQEPVDLVSQLALAGAARISEPEPPPAAPAPPVPPTAPPEPELAPTAVSPPAPRPQRALRTVAALSAVAVSAYLHLTGNAGTLPYIVDAVAVVALLSLFGRR